MNIEHYAFYLSNNENKQELISQILSGEIIDDLDSKLGEIFSEISLDKFIEEEKRHGQYDVISSGRKVSLEKHSEGEKRKALLKFIISRKPNFVIVDNILDNLDENNENRSVQKKTIKLFAIRNFLKI